MSELFDKNEMANTNEVRTHWGLAVNLHRREKRLAEFDRWLAETIRQAQDKAWDEGYRASGIVYPTLPPKHPTNPYSEEEEDKTND